MSGHTNIAAAERELFESGERATGSNLARTPDGHYENPCTQSAREGWLRRAIVAHAREGDAQAGQSRPAFPERDGQKRTRRIERALSAIIKADDNQALTQDLIEAGRRALDLPAQVRHGHAPTIEFTLRQAEALVEFFGGHDGEVSVMERPAAWADQPDGLYAYCTEYPDEGCQYLGPTEVDDDLATNGRTSTTSAAPAAWMHPDGRVVSAATMTTARRDGGAMASSLSGYVTPLVAAADVRDAIERAAQICEATCVCDDGTEDYEINWVLRNRAAKIRALFTTSAAPADAEKGGA